MAKAPSSATSITASSDFRTGRQHQKRARPPGHEPVAGGKTIQCSICHGADFKGIGDVPRLSGRGAYYLVRQLKRHQDRRSPRANAGGADEARRRKSSPTKISSISPAFYGIRRHSVRTFVLGGPPAFDPESRRPVLFSSPGIHDAAFDQALCRRGQHPRSGRLAETNARRWRKEEKKGPKSRKPSTSTRMTPQGAPMNCWQVGSLLLGDQGGRSQCASVLLELRPVGAWKAYPIAPLVLDAKLVADGQADASRLSRLALF